MPPKILVVEDKVIIAKDIQNTLRGLGYLVPATAPSGEKALEKVIEHQPDLVLMDIHLKGDMDGIATASQIRAHFDIPVVYLTAHADEDTLQRAKITEPFGYVIKPFEEKDLRVAVEIALYKHQVERKLKEQERWLGATLESIGDAVLTTNTNNQIISLNRAAQLLTGWSPDEAQGRSVTEIFHIVNEKTRIAMPSPLIQALQEGAATTLPPQTLLMTKDGAEIPVDDIATPIRDDQDNIIGGVLVFRDVSHNRLLEERLRQAQKMEAVGQLAAGIAHNFNNMLTAILGYAGMIEQSLPEGHAISHDLHGIQQTTQRAASLVRQLLAFTRHQVIQPRLLNLNGLIQEMSKMLQGLLSEDIELTLHLEPNPGQVKVDPNQIEQVLVNLVLNARDAMPEGGQLIIQTSNISLDQAHANQHVELSPGQYILLAVMDTGTGMTEEVMGRIFEPFFTTKAVDKGTGLGLSTCLGIIKQNNGYISVESRVGRGTTFKVYWPRVEAAPSLPKPQSKGMSTLARGETILLVEDEPQVRALIGQALRQQGYTVMEAGNGEEALHLLKLQPKQMVHLLITDVVMPKMGGKVLINLLKVLYPELKVLFISGYMDTAVASQDTAFLYKPFTPATLVRKARETLDSSVS